MRSIFRLSVPLALLGFLWCVPVFARAQSAPAAGTTQITGVVLDAQQHPVSGAQVRLTGPVSKTAATAQDGSFTFLDLPSGIFRLDISKAGFNTATQDDIVTAAGSTTNLSFTLQAVSLTSLTVIGNVSVSSHTGANSINTTPASIVNIPASTFTEQGQLSVNQILNQQPGITIGLGVDCFDNGASPLASGIPSIRGGLPYETESLIDGHAISLGESGMFSPSFISPYVLQNVEIVKGPGATSPSINYAINGTVNYRTLEPTVKPQESFDLGEDQYGGNFANLRATGTFAGGHLSYAFDYVTQGTQGFDRGYSPVAIMYSEVPTYLNGSLICTFGGIGIGPPPAGQEADYGAYSLSDSFMVCCPTVTMSSNQRNELAKIRYSFTPSTALTVTWLGGQSNGDYFGPYRGPCFNSVFAPPPGYTGSLQAGLLTTYVTGYGTGWIDENNANLFETEFHMPLGKTATLQVRQYSSSFDSFSGGPGDSGPTAAGTSTITGAVYGGVYYLPTFAEQTFNGEIGTFTYAQYSEIRSYNHLNGYTAEIDKQAGDDLLSLSYDEEKTSTYAEQLACTGAFSVTVPGGSSQTFQSLMGRVQFELGEYVSGTLSDNLGSYTDTYTQDGGVTYQSTRHGYQAPRLSLTWRPKAGLSVRGAVGMSIAPPYIALLNNPTVVQRAGGDPPPYYTEQLNSGDVLPETAFGFDLGFDARIRSPFTVLSLDVYQTILHNQFLQSTSEQGTYTCLDPSSFAYGDTAPLYVTTTANLGHSKYEGIEFSLHHTPPVGWGYRIQGSLQRAYVYDLPAGFYDTQNGPQTANLGILPGINFQGSLAGSAFSTMSTASVPYSTGYGEINYRGHNGAYFLVGLTYYGPNNSYNQPAFEVATASFNQPLTRHASLQLSVYNFMNVYPGISVPFNAPGIVNPVLVNGYLGTTIGNVLGPSIARLTFHVDL